MEYTKTGYLISLRIFLNSSVLHVVVEKATYWRTFENNSLHHLIPLRDTMQVPLPLVDFKILTTSQFHFKMYVGAIPSQ